MPDVLKPDRSSRENLTVFLSRLDDKNLYELLSAHLEEILFVGRTGAGKESQAHRDNFFESVQALIESRLRE